MNIFIYYQPQMEKFLWLETDEQDQIIQQESRDDLAAIASYTQQKQVYVLIPSALLYTTTVSIPGTNYNQILKAIPFALEEELSEDVEKLHFALGVIEKNKPVTVNVINKALLENIISNFTTAGIEIYYLIPDFFALPYSENRWNMQSQQDMLIIRNGMFSGFSINSNLASKVLPQLLQTKKPEKIIYHGTENIAEICRSIETTGIEFIQEPAPTSLLESAAKSLNTLPFINLLQGPYRVKHKADKARFIWYLAGATAGLWLVLLIIGTFFSYFYYDYQTNKLTAQINEIYKQVFPNATAVVDPKIRMQREIAKYQGANNDAGFLFLLAKLAAALKQQPTINLQSLNYQNNTLTISVKTSNFQTLQIFSNNLAAQGLASKQTNAATNNNLVTAEYTLSLESSSQ